MDRDYHPVQRPAVREDYRQSGRPNSACRNALIENVVQDERFRPNASKNGPPTTVGFPRISNRESPDDSVPSMLGQKSGSTAGVSSIMTSRRAECWPCSLPESAVLMPRMRFFGPNASSVSLSLVVGSL